MISTVVELVGFACWIVAAFTWASVPLEVITGLAVTGLVAVFVGYAMDDGAAVLSLVRIRTAIGARRAARKAQRAKRLAKKASPAT